MEVTIFTADSNGGFPVPAVKGGAVSTLIEALVKENNEKQLCDMTVVSLYEKNAKEIAEKKYPNIHFKYIKVPVIIKILDKFTFFIISTFFKNKKAISYKSIFSLLFYIIISSSILKHLDTDKVVLENNIPLAWIIRLSHYQGEYYFHLHNVPRINGECRDVFRNCTGYLCVSEFVAKEIESKNNPIGPIDISKIRILYNSIDTNAFYPLSNEQKSQVKKLIQKQYHIDNKDKIILFTGRLTKEKGIDILLDSVSNLKYKNYCLLIVGSIIPSLKFKDTFVNSIVEKIKQRKLENHVKFTGYVSHNKLLVFYNAADLVVLPSMWEEPAGLTMIEAIACGATLITTNSGGIPEYVGDVAYILKRNNEIVSNMTILIENCLSKTTKLNIQNIEKIKKRFSSKNYLENFLQCLQ